MKHILIITYGFAPANSMAAHRNYLRAKGLDALGYTVSVLTRRWDGPPSPPSKIVEETLFARSRAYRVPFGRSGSGRRTLFQSLLLRSDSKAFRYLRFFFCPLEYDLRLNVDWQALGRLLPGPPDVVLASGDPWSCFELGREAAKFFGAKYVAEYRDAWGYLDERLKIQGFNSYNDNVFSQLKRRYALRTERKLNQAADLVISVSEPILENALRITGARQGLVVTNGYDPEEFAAVPREKYPRFTLSYTGTIYQSQRSEVFFEALNLFMERGGLGPEEVAFKMVGSRESHGFEKTLQKLKAFPRLEKVVELMPRLGKRESLLIQKSSQVLVFCGHEDLIGIYSGKIFDYAASGTPILLTPSDHGLIAGLLRETRTGTVCDTVEETVRYLESAYACWKKSGEVPYDADLAAVAQYSYRVLNQRLAQKIESLEQ